GTRRQQAAGVRDHDRVVVDVGHARFGIHAPGDVVRVQRRGQPGADVDELPDAEAGHVADGAPEEPAVLLCHLRGDRVDREHLPGKLAVRREVVLPAQPEVPDPGDVRPGRVERLHRAPNSWQARYRAVLVLGAAGTDTGPGGVP